jgi:hypothetical protein
MDDVSGAPASGTGSHAPHEAPDGSSPIGFDPSRETTPWLHLRGQFSYHGEALISGSRAGLAALRDALDQAIENRDAEAEVFASDGEGYVVTIRRTARLRDMGDPPYVDQIAQAVADTERHFLRKHERYNKDLWADRWNRFRRDRDASLAEDAERLSGEAGAARAVTDGIAQSSPEATPHAD